MSETIDEKVVSIQFDNSKFERNVSDTMTTLDKLKQKLNFKGASQGLEDISKAAKQVSLTPIERSVEAVGIKFNGLFTIADQTLRNITNSVEHSAKRIVSAFTIDPIKTGFQEYETQINAVQTILANTESKGTTLDDVNAALDTLNAYADKTIYNFTEMTRNIGTFTAAGTDLETSVNAIQGIANLAAVSGSTSQQASTAMYQLSQALASGTVKLMDWNSVVNAGMGGQVFQDALKETARVHGVAIDDMIKKEGSFRETLKDGWLTSEILTETLQKFTLTTEDLTAEQIEQNRAMLKAKGYTDDQIESIFKLGKTATDAATKVKTFTQLMDTLKEAAQSGWTQTWELLVGDFEESKVLWTKVSDTIGEVINNSSQARNDLLGGALKSNWEKMTEELGTAGVSMADFEKSASKVLEKHGYDLDDIIKEYGNLGDGIKEMFTSGKASSDILKETIDGVKSSVLDLSGVTAGLKKGATGDDVKKIQEALKKAGYQCGEFGESLDGVDGKLGKVTEASIKAFQEANGLKVTGIVDEETLEALEKANSKTAKLKDSIYDLADGIDELGGRELLIKSIGNAFNFVKSILGSVKKAWDKVFGKSTSDASKQLYRIIDSIHEFTLGLKLDDEYLGKIQNGFEGFFTVVNLVKDVLVKVASSGAKLAWNVFKPLAKIVVTCASAFGKLLSGAGKAASNVFEPLGVIIDVIIDRIGIFAEFVSTVFTGMIDIVTDCFGSWKKTFENSKVFQALSEHVGGASEKISGAISSIQSSVDSLNFDVITTKAESIKTFFDNVITSLGNSEFVVSVIDNVSAAFEAFTSIFDNISFKLPTINFDGIVEFFTGKFAKLVQYLTENNFTGVTGTIKGIFSWIKSLFTTKITKLKNSVITNVTEFFVKSGDVIIAGFKKAKEVFAAIVEFMFGTKDVKMGDILDLANKLLLFVTLIQTLKMVTSVMNIAKNITGAFGDFANSAKQLAKAAKWRAIGDAFKSIAIALVAFTLCVVVLAKITNIEQAWKNTGIVLAMLVTMGIVVGALMFLASKIGGEIKMASVTLSLLAFAGAIGILVWVLKTIDATEFKNLKKSISVLVGTMAALALSVGIMGRMCGGTVIKAAGAIVTMLMAAKMIPEVLAMYAEYPWNTVKSGIAPMVAVLGGLALVCRVMTMAGKEGTSATGVALTLISLVISMKLLLGVIEKMGNMDTEAMWQGIKGISALLAGITAMLVTITLAAKLGSKSAGESATLAANFTGIASALLGVAATIYILGNMDQKALKQGGNATGMILAMFAGIMYTLGKAGGGNPFKGVLPMLIGMGLIIGEMYLVVRALSKIGWEKALGSASALGLLLVTLTGAVAVLGKCKDVSAKTLIKWSATLLVFSGVLAILAQVMMRMSNIDADGGIKQATSLALLLTTMTACLAIVSATNKYLGTEGLAKQIGAFIALSGILIILSEILRRLGGVNPRQAIGQVAALSLLLTTMVVCLGMLSLIAKTSKTRDLAAVTGIMLILGIVVAELAVILAFLGKMGVDGGNAIKQVLALAIILIAMGGCLGVLNAIAKTSREGDLLQVVGIMLVLGLVVAEVGVVLGLMKAMGVDGGQAIGHVTALSIMLLAMSGCMAILNIVAKTSREGDLLQVVGIMFALGLVVAEISVVLGLMGAMGVQSGAAIGHATALSELLLAMSGCMAILNIVAKTASEGDLLQVVGLMAGFGLVVGEIAIILALLHSSGISGGQAIAFATALSGTLIALTGCALVAIVIGKLAGAALAGLGVVAAFFTALVATLVILGGIEELTNGGFSNILDNAVLIMTKLGEAIGAFFGGIGKGGLEAISSTLPQLGSDLSAFMANASGFFDGLNNISFEMVGKAALIAPIIGALEALALMNGWANLFSIGHSLPNLGTDLGAFFANGLPFFDGLKGMDASVVGAAHTLAETIGILTAADFLTGLSSFLGFGESSFGSFGTTLSSFGESMKSFCESVSGLTEADIEHISIAAEAGKKLAALSNALPKEDGWAQKIFGQADMGSFGKQAKSFGESLMSFATSVMGLTDEHVAAIKRSADGGTALANLAGKIPNEGGWAGAIMGENDMAVFGKKMVAFGTGLVAYAAVVAPLSDDDASRIESSAKAGTALTNLADAIPNEGGWAATIMGENDMVTFGKKIVAFGSSLIEYAKTVSSLTDGDAESILISKKCAEALATVANAIPKTDGGWWGAIAGEKDLAVFGAGMTSLAKGVKDYAMTARTLTEDDATSIMNSKTAIEAMNELGGVISRTGGWGEAIVGTKDFSGFASGMSSMATSVKTCVAAAKGIAPEDVDLGGPIYRLRDAIVAMSVAAKSLPNEGGLVAMLSGDNTEYATFGSGMVTLAGQIKKCLNVARTINEEDVTKEGPIYRLKNAIIAMTDAAKAVPNEGGLVALISGDNADVATFGAGMVTLAGQVRSCLGAARAITEEDVAEGGAMYRLKNAIIAMTDAAKAVPNEGGLVALLAGDNNEVATFGSGMVTLAGQVRSCLGAARAITEEDTAEGGPFNRLKMAIIAMADAAKAIPNSGGLVGLLSGDNDDMGAFGSGMVKLAGQVKSCLTAARAVTEEDIAESGPLYRLRQAIFSMVNAAKAIPIDGSIIALIGENGVGILFATNMTTLINKVKTCLSSARSITEEDVAEGGPMSRLRTVISGLINAVPTEFVDNTAGIDVLVGNIDRLVGAVGRISAVDAGATSSFVQAVNNLGNISVKTLTDSISRGSTTVSTMFGNMLRNCAQMLTQYAPLFQTSGATLITSLVKGIMSKSKLVDTQIEAMMNSAVDAINAHYDSFSAAGGYLGDGLIAGINSKVQAVYDAAYALGQAAVQGEKDGQQSHSPSKATIQAGHWLGEGLVIGLDEMGRKVYNAGSNMGSTASDSISGALNTALDLLNGEMESQPTIRPVLDLSDIQSGAGAINGMFGFNPSVGVLGTVDAINTSMNQRNQNGVNDDVVTAINKLRKDIGGLQSNTYNVNGVTYDDGSNISAAVQSLVRAAKVERRI